MNKNDEFFDNFNDKDKILLNDYFIGLNDNILLTKKEKNLFNKDFASLILYFYKDGMKVKKILELLSVDKLGTCYKDNPTYFYPLDNAAKIYPLSMRENWMSVYRLSYYLKSDVIPEVLQVALIFTMKRFPTFRTSIRKGFFWHYIDGLKRRFHIYEDKMLPCSYINVSNIGKQSFKVLYYKNRISVEYFHILTDGTGGVVFLSTLVSTYLNLLDLKIPTNDIVLDITSSVPKEETIDEFTTRKKSKKSKSLVDTKALQIDGKLSNIKPCQILHFDINLDKIKNLSKKNDATITEIMLTFLFIVLSYSTSKDGYIKIQVPVNMRKYHKSNTLRNFALYVVISIKRDSINDFKEVLKEVKRQMKEKNTKEALDETMTYTNRLLNSLKFIPLFIKKPIASIVYGYLGDKVLTTVLSNLGNIDIPEEMKKEIEKMDFTLGTGITNRVLFSIITCNNILTLSISKSTLNTSVENNLYNLLKKYGITPYIHGSEVYENKK